SGTSYDRAFMITKGHIKQYSVPLSGLVHVQFLERTVCPVHHGHILDRSPKIHTNFSARIFFCNPDRFYYRFFLSSGKVITEQYEFHPKSISGTFSLPSCALKYPFSSKPNNPAIRLVGNCLI